MEMLVTYLTGFLPHSGSCSRPISKPKMPSYEVSSYDPQLATTQVFSRTRKLQGSRRGKNRGWNKNIYKWRDFSNFPSSFSPSFSEYGPSKAKKLYRRYSRR